MYLVCQEGINTTVMSNCLINIMNNLLPQPENGMGAYVDLMYLTH